MPIHSYPALVIPHRASDLPVLFLNIRVSLLTLADPDLECCHFQETRNTQGGLSRTSNGFEYGRSSTEERLWPRWTQVRSKEWRL